MRSAEAVALPRPLTLPAIRGRAVARIAGRVLGFMALSLLLLDEIGCPVSAYVDGIGRIYFAGSSHAIARVNGISGEGLVRIGEEGSGERQFKTPWGIAADAAGRIYVVDSENHRIVRISDMAGSGWTVLGRQGSGVREFSSPAGLALDARGRIYVADSGNHRIVRMDDITGAGWTTFHPQGILAGLPQYRPGMEVRIRPAAITVDGAERIYFTDRQHSRIVRISDMTGAGLAVLGQPGSGAGQFMDPLGIAVDRAGRIYVADTENHRIVRVTDMTGRGWVAFGNEGNGVGQFDTPTAAAIDLVGRIYVVDFMNDRIVRMENMNGDGWTVLDTYTGESSS